MADIRDPKPSPARAQTQKRLIARFALLGAALGLAAGFWEAGLLFFRPRLSTLQEAEAGLIIWFLAPLVDAALFGLLGGLLGAAAGLRKSIGRHATTTLAFGLLVGPLGAHATWSYSLSREWVGNLTAFKDLAVPLQGSAVALAAGLVLAHLGERRISQMLVNPIWSLMVWTRLLLVPVLFLATGVGFFASRAPAHDGDAGPNASSAKHPSNIVLITLDAARADHFSSYGYGRPTTPNIDRLAARGVLFENAIAPSSWTLPSHASILNGLLPHQHGADEGLPASPAVRNLPEILNARGYETAGFNTNTLYGQAAWGLGHGFDTYRDYKDSFRYNLALTVAGRVLLQPVYERWVRYDLFCRRNAEDMTDAVLRWRARKRNRPFFLFVHYFEPHDSYLPPRPYDRRFGRMSNELARRVSFGRALVPDRPFTDNEQRDIIAAYDNGLAYADEQIGRLLHELEASPEGRNTYIIVTADHGEAFGEHGSYGHGWTLHREVLHVPLIIAGPGVPSGLRISRVARTRELFPTVIELSLGERFPFTRASLRRFWNPGFQPEPYDEGATSELSSGRMTLGKPPAISVMTSEWHYIHDATGREELYHWPDDPEEKADLSGLQEHQDTVRELHDQLVARMGTSIRPWSAPHYLFAFDRPGYSFLRELAFGSRTGDAPPGLRVGMSQAYFPRDPSEPSSPRIRSDEDLLRSLPYR